MALRAEVKNLDNLKSASILWRGVACWSPFPMETELGKNGRQRPDPCF